MNKGALRPLRVLVPGFLIAACIPLLIGNSQYSLFLATTVLFYALLATAWNIIGGMAGQLDLAAGAYLGLGAFTSGTLLLRWNITPWIGMPLGGLVAALFAWMIGMPLFRFKVREVWYALTSSAFVEVMRVVFLMWAAVGGPMERYLPSHAHSWYHLRFNTYQPYYYILLVGLVIVLYLTYRIRNSKLGYQLLALGEDEDAAAVVGVDVRAAKLKALMIYAFIVGMTGGLYVCIYGYLHPSFFDSNLSLEVAVLGIVGGLGITGGPLLSAVVLVTLRELLRARLGGELAGIYLMIYATVLILVALYQPRGLAVMLSKGWNRIVSLFRGGQGGKPADTAGA